MKSKHVLNIKHGKNCICTYKRYIVQYTIISCCITGLFDNFILYTIISCCITGLSYIITIGTVLYYHCTVLVARPTENKVRQTLPLPSAANWSLRRPPRLDRPEAVACAVFCPNAVAGVSASADLCDTMLVLFFAQGAKAYFAWVVFSCPLRNSFLISRHHANIRRWCYGVAPWVDVSEIPWRLTEALAAELSVCVALGWSLYKIYSVQKFHQSRHLAKTKLHPEYPQKKNESRP